MITEKIIFHPKNCKVKDTITLSYNQRFIRRKKLVSDNKIEFLVNLPETVSLNKNNGFLLDDDSIIIIKCKKEELLEIISENLMKIIWHIGNRHIPCQIEKDRLLIQHDKVIEKLIIKLGGHVRKIKDEFDPEGGAYGLGRTHGHKH
ncbi:urease accessory protein UreE [Alphaproteobacteria bacterium]|jgi:urease accessory protein|nr:urease accessory protein UreE [Alphaproteobacteria bacterium]MDC1134362.1 urease accessory protein UreE [Alphaproteobacteria bacterium]